MIACRIIQGCGLGALLALVPIYLAEVAPPRSRGLLTGLTVLSFGFGFVAWVFRPVNRTGIDAEHAGVPG